MRTLGFVTLLALFATDADVIGEDTPPRAPFEVLMASLPSEAERSGVSRATFELATADLAPDSEVLALAQRQPEHMRSAGSYVTALVSAERIETGQRKLAELAETLKAIEPAYGVDRHILVAIWAIESNFGVAAGTRGVVRSLATLAAYDVRRSAFWRAELLAALRIVQRGDTTLERLTGSWAGAMGHTQFMPSTYQAHAVDFDRDGRRDIWHTLSDALASAANYLRASGWRAGEPWGFEVTVPPGFDFVLSAPAHAKRAADWQKLGVKVPDGRPWPRAEGEFRLELPAGHRGPAFLVGRNFRALLRYNMAVAYALAIGNLADQLAGRPAITAPWPDADRPLEQAEREELQRRLTARGLNTGGIDGILGTDTRAAIRSFQTSAGVPPDGHPSAELLELLRREDRP